LPAETRHRFVLGLEDLDLRQSILRNAVAEHPARRRVALEDRHVVAGDQQVIRGGHAGWPRPDDRGLPAALRLDLEGHRRGLAGVEDRLVALAPAGAMRGPETGRR